MAILLKTKTCRWRFGMWMSPGVFSLFASVPAYGTVGACCDDATNTCVERFEIDCARIGWRFGGVGSECATMDPPCGCTPLDCDDGVACTVDECRLSDDVCTHAPDIEFCGNQLACDGMEYCDPLAGCQPGTPPDCDSLSDDCNVGFCDEDAGGCVTRPVNEGGSCTDGSACSVGESCRGGVCAGGSFAECPIGDPVCGDCNVNGVADDCDIEQGGSEDVDPEDGIPDECLQPDSKEGSWTNDIWNLGGENPDAPFPDNDDGVAGLHVTIDGSTIFLDETVVVESLRLLNDAILKVTEAGAGDLTISPQSSSGILNEGSIVVGNDRAIEATNGTMVIGRRGAYVADASSAGVGCDPGVAVCASLKADRVVLKADELMPGRMILDSAMSVTTLGDLVLDGSDATLPCGGASGLHGVAGGRAPPTMKFRNDSSVDVGSAATTAVAAGATGHLIMLGSVDFENSSSVPVSLGGDFDNRTRYAQCFDSSGGGFRLDGSRAQSFEVAGRDFGAVPQGFDTGADTNYSIGILDIASRSDVTFSNHQANVVGAGPCREALYVHELVLSADSRMTLDNCRVYYETLKQGKNVEINRVGCGDLEQVTCRLVDSASVEAGGVDKHRYIGLTPGNADEETAIRVTLADLRGFDGFNGQVRWLGPPSEFPDEDRSDPDRTFMAASLQCEPHFMDWGRVGLLQVYGAAIVPGSTYDFQVAHATCARLLENEFAYSDALTIQTAKWGDVVAPFDKDGGPNQPDFLDIFSIVRKFQEEPGAPPKARVQLQPSIPDPSVKVDFLDIAAAVDAFRGLPYPFDGPSACP